MIQLGKTEPSTIFPDGVSKVADLPSDFFIAFEQATRILSWQENLSEDEMPPRWMWHLDWELDEWFLDVKKKRDERFGASSGESYENTPESGAVWEDNEYSSRFFD
jgi:hypothetical protein